MSKNLNTKEVIIVIAILTAMGLFAKGWIDGYKKAEDDAQK